MDTGFSRRALCGAALAAGLLTAGGAAPPAVSTLAEGVAQASRPEVDQYIQALLAEQHIAGVSLVVVSDGTIILAKGYGYLDGRRPLRPEDFLGQRFFSAPARPAQAAAGYPQHTLTVMAFTSGHAGRLPARKIVRAVSHLMAVP